MKTEADSNDMTKCSHNDKPTVGMFGMSIQFVTVTDFLFYISFLLARTTEEFLCLQLCSLDNACKLSFILATNSLALALKPVTCGHI